MYTSCELLLYMYYKLLSMSLKQKLSSNNNYMLFFIATSNDYIIIYCFIDGTDKQVETAKSAMEPIAIPYFEEHESKNDALIFRYAKNGDFDESLKKFIGIIPPFPVLVIVDVPNQRKYICDKSGNDLNESVVRQFLNDYLTNKLTGQEIEG